MVAQKVIWMRVNTHIQHSSFLLNLQTMNYIFYPYLDILRTKNVLTVS